MEYLIINTIITKLNYNSFESFDFYAQENKIKQ